MTERPPSLLLRLGLLLGSSLLSLGVAELVVRWADGGALPTLDIFEATLERPGIALAPRASGVTSGAGKAVSVHTGLHGLRVPVPPQIDWLVVGDSQALGLGVMDDEHVAAALQGRGVRAANAGVVAYGLEDALARARTLLPLVQPTGIIVIVNRANDWDELGAPVDRRFQVAGGWLLPHDLPAWLRAFYAGPLSKMHLFYHALRLGRSYGPTAAPGDWVTSERIEERSSARMQEALEAFAQRVAPVQVLVVEVPIDVFTDPGRRSPSWLEHTLPSHVKDRWREGYRGLALARADATYTFLDVDPYLRLKPGVYLDGDYHLSPFGNSVLAAALARQILGPDAE